MCEFVTISASLKVSQGYVLQVSDPPSLHAYAKALAVKKAPEGKPSFVLLRRASKKLPASYYLLCSWQIASSCLLAMTFDLWRIASIGASQEQDPFSSVTSVSSVFYLISPYTQTPTPHSPLNLRCCTVQNAARPL